MVDQQPLLLSSDLTLFLSPTLNAIIIRKLNIDTVLYCTVMYLYSIIVSKLFIIDTAVQDTVQCYIDY